MDLTAKYTFDATPEDVWAVLMDTEAIASCLPGSKGLHPLGDNRYEAELSAGVAAVSGDFKAIVELRDQVPPHSYTLVFEATGRPGFVKGNAQITLTNDAGTTVVDIAAHAEVGGMIARVGQRLIDGVARMTMDRFFNCLGQRFKK